MRRYRIFISSTIDDLQQARADIDEELRSTEIFEPVRVEDLPAAGEPSRRVCLDEVAASDALVLILADRYGFVPEDGNPGHLSVTHLEYREAKRRGKPVFAFVHDVVEPEPDLVKLIQEVSDFDEGVLRKKWRSTEQLRSEVRRALLFWLARRARESPCQEVHEQAGERLARHRETAELPVLLDAELGQDEIGRAWHDGLVEQLSHECQRRLLPKPRTVETALHSDCLSTLRLRIRPAAQNTRLAVTIDVLEREGMHTLPPPLQVEAARTPKGARFAAECSLALVLIAADDWSAGIDQLFAAARNPNASHQTRARLVGAAAYISALNQGQRSSEVVGRMLDLPKLDSPAVSAGVMSLVSAELRLEHAHGHRALRQVEQLALRLLTLALSRDKASPEMLYNLARQCLKHSAGAALAFYSELLRTDPSYDERWYVHRDLGLIHYGSDRYQDAALHYDRACDLKDNDSELFRFAGDAYYYQGYWAKALIRYERAVDIEPVETYSLDGKVSFAKARIRKGVDRDTGFRRKRSLSHCVSRVASRPAEAGMQWIARPLFRTAKRFCDLNFDADRWLALYANRKGAYADAIDNLKGALAAVPEDPSARLNLAMNLIFQNDGRFAEESRGHTRIAIFHGGPETRNRFRLLLTNTRNRDELCREFDEIFDAVRKERDEWIARRKEVMKPEMFGGVMHFDFRP